MDDDCRFNFDSCQQLYLSRHLQGHAGLWEVLFFPDYLSKVLFNDRDVDFLGLGSSFYEKFV